MKIAVVGATGLVGRKIINLCEEYFESDAQYSLYASSKSAGSEMSINNKNITVQELSEKNISNFDLALFQLVVKELSYMLKVSLIKVLS